MHVEDTPHPVFPMALSRLGNLLTVKLLLSVDASARFGILGRPLRVLRSILARIGHAITTLRDNWRPHAEDTRNYIVGDLAVLSNEYTGSARIRATNAIEPMDMRLEFLPRWEIDNHPDLAYSWSRMTRMLRHVQGNDATVVKLRSAINLGATGLTFAGLSAEEFIAAAFAVYTQVRRITPADQTKCIIDFKTLSSELGMLPSLVRRFLRGTATSISTYERLLRPPITDALALRDFLATDAAATDVLLLLQRPIVRLSWRKFLVLDAHFIVELVASQMYWMIFEKLVGAQRERFRELWGRIFELYLNELLAHSYPAASQILSADVAYAGGQVDALLDFGRVVIVFEFKASLLLRGAKFSRDPAQFEKEVRRKFIENEKGNPKALRQLANSATAIADRRIRTLTPPDRIFPVLVVDETAFQGVGMNEYLNQLFRPLIAAEDARRIRPLTVMSVEELEEVLPYVEHNDTSWQGLFEERFKGDEVALESVHQILHFFHEHNGVPLRRNTYVLAEFERVWKTMIQTYRTNHGPHSQP